MRGLTGVLLALVLTVLVASPVFAVVGVPTGFTSYPTAETVGLTWTKGTDSTETLIRYSETTYPTTISEGTQVYLGPLANYSHTDLTSGHTYYYSAWGKDGESYSGTYATVMATTAAGAAEGEEPGALTVPTTWFQTPDYTKFAALPFYDTINAFYDSFQVPRASGWFSLAIIGCMVFGIVVFAVSRSPTPSLLALAGALAVVSLAELIPMWMMAFSVIFGLGALQLGRAS